MSCGGNGGLSIPVNKITRGIIMKHMPENFLERKLDNFSLRHKLWILYIICVLIPLFVTDGVILAVLIREERASRLHEMEGITEAIQSELSFTLSEIASRTNKIMINERIHQFLINRYRRPVDYVEAMYEMTRDSLFTLGFAASNSKVTIYADNETIINGNYFYRLSTVLDQAWYQTFLQSGRDKQLLFYYGDERDQFVTPRRQITYIAKADYYPTKGDGIIIRYDLDYTNFVNKMNDRNYDLHYYVCDQNTILFSNIGYSNHTDKYEMLTGTEKIDYEHRFQLYGQDFRVLIPAQENSILDQLREDQLVILLLLAINIILPYVLTRSIYRSFTSRLQQLSLAFDHVNETPVFVQNIHGKDEIASLMRNYNAMVQKSQELVQTVFKEKILKQEMDIARQNAELRALQTQINPHFLYNALESIRMHSLIKKEEETAQMIARLALLERQSANWMTDQVTIHSEMSFIEAYLELQRTRFSNRLTYDISVEEDCMELCLPKLTLVTFVENACVHGVESKASGSHIFVRIYRKDNILTIEVEDTGKGISEELAADLNRQIRECSFDTLSQTSHVGIVNACLRLKMFCEKVTITLESEEGIGTMVTIRIPIEEEQT
jgi:two-component system sensor histidine kinase YesM